MPHIMDYIGRRAHLIGIGGSSMSGLAGMLRTHGIKVTGSDRDGSYLTRMLEEQGIPVSIGHKAENVHGADIVIYSAAIKPDNPERAEAARLGIPQMERATLLGQLMEGYKCSVNVCGTHGKTTTSSMIGEILLKAGFDPTIHIGGQLDAIGGSTRVGGHDVFVAEACEFNRSFLQFHPTVCVVTNIEEDHLDCYKDLDDIQNAFRAFMALLPSGGVCIGNGDDPRVVQCLSELSCKTETFGFGESCSWRPEKLAYDDHGCASFDAFHNGEFAAHVELHIPGPYSAIHALTALAVCTELGAPSETVCRILSEFTAPHRRFEYTGTVCRVKLYTDYGHNPAEMATAVDNAVHQPHNRVIAVMQPHTYSRVKTLFKDYIHCCDKADMLLITDIFAAREVDPGDIHSTMLVDAIAKSGMDVHYTPTFDDAERFLRSNWQEGDIVITMSCGNINQLNEQIQAHGDHWQE